MYKSIIGLGFALALTACVSEKETAPVQTSVASVEIALTAAEKLALNYTTLPRCGTAFVPLCSDPVVVAKIKSMDNTAYNAVVAARKDTNLIAAALIAVNEFSSIVPVK